MGTNSETTSFGGSRRIGWRYLILAALALLPVIILRDFTPDNELRYLSIADEAIRNHTFFAFTNHGVPYADKPPLYLWIVMACRYLAGGHRMWLLSLFSLLPALGIVRIMDRWTARGESIQDPFPAGLMLLTSVYFLGAAVVVRMDMLMCLFIVLALREFWRMWVRNRQRGSVGKTRAPQGVEAGIGPQHCSGDPQGVEAGIGQEDCVGAKEVRRYRKARWLFPIYLFLALFTKGPYGLLIPLAGTLVFLAVSGDIRHFFRYWGWRTWLVLVALCALWFGAVYLEGGSDYLNDLLFHQTVGRAVNSFHHKAPLYYYCISIWYSIAPWSLLVIPLTVIALIPPLRRKVFSGLEDGFLRKNDLLRFFIAVGLTTFVVLSCISSKLQIYMLPAFPFMIYSGVMLLSALGERVWPRMKSVLKWIGIGMLIAVFVAGWFIPLINPRIGYGALCSEALELSGQYGITDFRTWHVSRAENMDVYLHAPVQVIEDEAEPADFGQGPHLLMVRTEDLPLFPGLESHAVGPYAVVVCP